MYKKFVPGHVRGHTLGVCIALTMVAYGVTGSALSVLGVFLLVTGMFLGDQATHLAQENHQGVQLTWIETQQQKYRYLFVFCGYLLSILGLLLLLSS